MYDSDLDEEELDDRYTTSEWVRLGLGLVLALATGVVALNHSQRPWTEIVLVVSGLIVLFVLGIALSAWLETTTQRPDKDAGMGDLEVMLMVVGTLMLGMSIVALFQNKDGIGAFMAVVAILPITIARTMRHNDDEPKLRLSPLPIPRHMYERNGHERGLIRDGLVHLSLAAFCCIGAVVLCFTSPWQAAFELSIFAVFFGACGLAISLHDKPKKLANRQEKQEV